jgi:CDP-glucose 4,6-dehydratase
VKIASCRAGNVIGGGDWAADRIIPDCIRALKKGAGIPVRNRRATRPWQHVLEPLSGYLWLGACLTLPKARPRASSDLASAFNFGPNRDANRTVKELVEEVLRHWPGRWQDKTNPNAPHEAGLLQLSTDKAAALLRWFPVWSFSAAVAETVQWYRKSASFKQAKEFQTLTRRQISQYVDDARTAGLPWAVPKTNQ